MNEVTQKRLAALRNDHAMWTALTDTSSWESTFYLSLIDDLMREKRRLQIKLNEKGTGKCG
jgi:hypothetical protein